MSTVLGIWHLILKGGEAKNFITPAAVQITNVSLGEEIVDTNGRSVVKLSFESLAPSDEEDKDDKHDDDSGLSSVSTVLCSLIPTKIEQVALNVTLGSDEGYTLQVTGKNTVYFTGHYLDQRKPEDAFSDSDFDSDEGAYDLREVSSDVEMHPDDLDGLESNEDRFDEVNEVEKPAKRPRDSGDDSASKPGKKKLKTEGGNAVPADHPTQDKVSKKEKKKKKESVDKPEKQQNDEPKSKPAGNKAPKITIAGGIEIQDFITGTGPMAKKGDTVAMRYIGKLTNGKVFDRNTKGNPFTFNLGKGEVIKGWDEGIVGMQVGSERIMTIPPNMGYGKRSQGGIPPNSTLIFEVKLLQIN